jgi:hypothetical protein
MNEMLYYKVAFVPCFGDLRMRSAALARDGVLWWEVFMRHFERAENSAHNQEKGT